MRQTTSKALAIKDGSGFFLSCDVERDPRRGPTTQPVTANHVESLTGIPVISATSPRCERHNEIARDMTLRLVFLGLAEERSRGTDINRTGREMVISVLHGVRSE